MKSQNFINKFKSLFTKHKKELIEIESLFWMDTGAPSPQILSNDSELLHMFYALDENNEQYSEDDSVNYDEKVIFIKFKRCSKYTFGGPNDEALHGHPYYKLGLGRYAFYELKNSDYIKSLQEINKCHDRYNPKNWTNLKHYILTFHDNMFECIAEDFEINIENNTNYNQVKSLINNLSKQ